MTRLRSSEAGRISYAVDADTIRNRKRASPRGCVTKSVARSGLFRVGKRGSNATGGGSGTRAARKRSVCASYGLRIEIDAWPGTVSYWIGGWRTVRSCSSNPCRRVTIVTSKESAAEEAAPLPIPFIVGLPRG